jgi:hypothetical protein
MGYLFFGPKHYCSKLTKFNHNQNGRVQINLFKNDTLVKLDNGDKKTAREGGVGGFTFFQFKQ